MRLLLLFIFLTSMNSFSQKKWDNLTQDDKSEILNDLEYNSTDLPVGLKVLNVAENYEKTDKKTSLRIKKFIKKSLSTFENEVSRESIEQTDYLTYGEEEVIYFGILLNEKFEILGANLIVYQDGREENGEESDVNWTVSIRLDEHGEIFKDESGNAYDELYFEWSGY